MRKRKINFEVDDLIREVRLCDKSFGVKVKKSNAYAEPDKIFEIACAEASMYIGKLITVLNGINPSVYFAESESFGVISGPIGPKNIEFTELSDLEWEEDNKYPIDSLKFKCRFLTPMLNSQEGGF